MCGPSYSTSEYEGNALINCAHAARQRERNEAADLLAFMLSEEFGAKITPEMVTALLRDKWYRVQQLAHYVHDRVRV